MPWLTPELVPLTRRCWRVFVPDDECHEAAFRGALTLLSNTWSWQAYGASTPEECAQLWTDANYETFSMEECGGIVGGSAVVGSVSWFAGQVVPTGYLVCDGGSYNSGDYPDLFVAIGNTWGGTPPLFNVPDLEGSFIRGSGGVNDIGDTGGEEEHTLTTLELPSHSHTVTGPTNVRQTSTGSGGTAYPPSSDYWLTNPTGGDQPHNNIPPFASMMPIIKALP